MAYYLCYKCCQISPLNYERNFGEIKCARCSCPHRHSSISHGFGFGLGIDTYSALAGSFVIYSLITIAFLKWAEIDIPWAPESILDYIVFSLVVFLLSHVLLIAYGWPRSYLKNVRAEKWIEKRNAKKREEYLQQFGIAEGTGSGSKHERRTYGNRGYVFVRSVKNI